MKSFSFQRQNMFFRVTFLSIILLSFQFSGCTVFTGFFGDAGCGDGLLQIDVGEECDDGNNADGDGCDANCLLEAICGDGLLQIEEGEECDDGNNVDGDGCDANCLIEIEDLCGVDFLIADDGSVEANDNTGFPDIAEGICQNLNEGSGGADVVFQVIPVNSGALDLRVTSDADLVLFARTECENVNTELNCSDQAGAGNAVESISISVTLGVPVFVIVGGFDDGDEDSFVLEVSSRTTICGDGVNDPGEECDDGNGVNGDRCDNQCQLNTVLETEPNEDGSPAPGQNDFASENANGPFTQDTIIRASIFPSGDEDVFEIKNPDPNNSTAVFIETFGRDGEDALCGIDDVALFVHNAQGIDGGEIDDDNNGFCELVDLLLAPDETVFLRVRNADDNIELPRYFVDINFQ